MTAAVILEILNGLLGAAPELLALFQTAQSKPGTVVPSTDVQAILAKYGIDRAVFVAAIATAEAKQAALGASTGTAGGLGGAKTA